MENTPNTNSILDKVMQAKEEEELASFNPVEIIAKLFSELGSREQDILRRRFGLYGKGNETLEQIGKSYEVTRERVRQIENAAIKHIRDLGYFTDTVKPVEVVVLTALEKHGGIMSEDHMLEYLLSSDVKDESYCKHLLFLLEKLTKNRILREQRSNYKPSWRMDFVEWDRAENTIKELVKILESHGQPITQDELISKFRETPVFSDHLKHYNFDEEAADPIYAHLRTTEKIKPNPFDEWGLSNWNTVTPKRMGDKIYLVMKKHGKPLHFRDIATHINDAQFDSKKAYPPTVHNELILDDRYVLVGRGIYGLKEWGFAPGVVSDVIESILSKANGPLTRNEIVEEVLSQRMVKKGTVYLALSNSQRFAKDSEGKYKMVDAVQAQ
ncbi:hypothetical protein CL632_02645 [bacterium]|jgi:hypothetical protein|nr:hypothetical protein [bacterium]MDP6571251.1 sigma factor-like helix-turn-helix DNA-binding protein [Patescibacteria group bacterium]MDP6756351.1 sigma factor-like helix-turn-helix DNA-binding protein [Patescibacteria group bacterium]|tara:strand:+ start:38311 stop:39462 length:1152 start_codon:yes stop_codon:yes gene_type:complete